MTTTRAGPLLARPTARAAGRAAVATVLLALGIACGGAKSDVEEQPEPVAEPVAAPPRRPQGQAGVARAGNTPAAATATPSGSIAYFYQTVGAMQNGVGENTIRMGVTSNLTTVQGKSVDAVSWQVGPSSKATSYGDPVFSRLPDGTWTMTAWSGPTDPRGRQAMLYYRGTCPNVQDDAVVALNPATRSGCESVRHAQSGKTSPVFDVDGEVYVVHAVDGEIYLAHLGSPAQTVSAEGDLCMRKQSVRRVADLPVGDSTRIISRNDASNMILSDTAIGRRADGTWVLFVKGIANNHGCSQASSCELCARSIYRTTSKDLISWSKLEAVVNQASVPEAVTVADGTIWLYWQDFAPSCAANDLRLAAVAPVSAAYELPGTYKLSAPTAVTFQNEPTSATGTNHEPTNGNPIFLPDAAAIAALDACIAVASPARPPAVASPQQNQMNQGNQQGPRQGGQQGAQQGGKKGGQQGGQQGGNRPPRGQQGQQQQGNQQGGQQGRGGSQQQPQNGATGSGS